jgi:2-polyprenyl-6-methoxyphenol hydroxylase-like FAD-dependent oxidoreductase
LTLARYGHHTLMAPAGRRLAVIGDASHSTSPQLGQGANMALLDARALAYAVETTGDVETALRAYVRMRRLHIRFFQALSFAFTPFYQSDSRTLPFIRDRLVATIAKIPPAPQFLAAMVSGTLIDPFKPIGLKETAWSILAGKHPK